MSAENSPSALTRLEQCLAAIGPVAVAVSGGVDSMTLASVAHAVLGERLMVVHALSPAVPPEASERVRDYAQRLHWPLQLVNAGEFEDERYRRNPVNRCYYCKTNLYARLRKVWDGPIASGANLDDLGDYRPGLLAARENEVLHPLIEAGIDKSMVRAIAHHRQLHDLAELPAQPCLSSRVETGIVIDAMDLHFVHRVERVLAEILGPGDLRCRLTADGVRIEVPSSLQDGQPDTWAQLRQTVERMIEQDGRVLAGFTAYRKCSAFLHETKVEPADRGDSA